MGMFVLVPIINLPFHISKIILILISSPIRCGIARMSMCCIYYSKLQFIRFLNSFILIHTCINTKISNMVTFSIILNIRQPSYLSGTSYLSVNKDYDPNPLFSKLLNISHIYLKLSESSDFVTLLHCVL